ncbi:MAG TPA: tRNA pseudouridine(55) synthase TruB [Blastocatellia bacterium]|nr:tRNA pseudouridine(55) synthase TruB [Blastocatellia bacterium]
MDGSLIIDKPEGITSHTVVARVRRVAGTRRVGHAGTLDPFATGVLVVCVGRGTRLSQFLVGLDKEYVATIRLGFATDTQDLTGKQITPLESSYNRGLEGLCSVLDDFRGPQMQTPPMFSAKKVAGERLYRAARAGRVVERQPVAINVYSIDLIEDGMNPRALNEDGTRDFVVRVRCSSGTYVRTLAHDIGERLGAGGHLAALRRTAVGSFAVSRAIGLEELERAGSQAVDSCLIGMAETVAHLPAVELDADAVKAVTNGREIELSSEAAFEPDAVVRILDRAGGLVAVGDFDKARGVVKPRVVVYS